MTDQIRVTNAEKRQRRRHSRKPPKNPAEAMDNMAIDIRVGNRRSPSRYNAIRVASSRDDGIFQRMVDNTVRSNPGDPLLIVVNGYRPWLENIFSSCIDDHGSEPGITNREVQFANSVQFPQRSMRKTKWVPWTFIIDEMNLPEVYYWSFDMDPPGEAAMADVDQYRFRIGAWTCGRGGYTPDDRVAVTILFTLPTLISENIVKRLLFTHLYDDAEFDAPKKDEEGLCWLFLHLYNLLTDWQNINQEVERRLDESEENSRGRNLPVKLRTRTMHREVDRIYELNEYLRFHSRSFKKLVKLKDSVNKDEQDELVWEQMDDALDDLESYGCYLESLKERFNNLIELEFNIENATQSDNSRFLGILGTLFLPISFLASVFGITTITWPSIWYLYAVVPVFFVSLFFTVFFPATLQHIQKVRYPEQKKHVLLNSNSFKMLGDDLPDSADVPKNIRYKNGGQRRKNGMSREPGHMDDHYQRSSFDTRRSRSRGARRTRRSSSL